MLANLLIYKPVQKVQTKVQEMKNLQQSSDKLQNLESEIHSSRISAINSTDKYKKSKLKIIQKKTQRKLKRQQNSDLVSSNAQQKQVASKQQAAAPENKFNQDSQTNKTLISKSKNQNEKFNTDKNINQIEQEKDEIIEKLESEVFAKPTLQKSYQYFSELNINDKLKEVLKMNNYETLTNIQRDAIPKIIENRNVVLKSETGSGKTMAYLVPLIEYLSHYSLTIKKIKREDSGTMAIIFSPTRELAVQIDIELRKLLKLFYYMVSTTLMGGESPSKEKSRLRKGCVILICTPGRLLYHLQNTKCLKLSNLQYLIFDEADRILDCGFEKEMNQCLQILKQRCPQNFSMSDENLFWSNNVKINFVSATMNPKIETLGKKLMENYIKVGFEDDYQKINNKQQNFTEYDDEIKLPSGDEDLVKSIPKQIQQYYMEIPIQYRLLYLLSFLYTNQDQKIIIFASNCELVNFLEALFKKYDWNQCGRRIQSNKEVQDLETEKDRQILFNGNIYKLHGDLEHEFRKMNYFAFDKIKIKDDLKGGVLICTDVASRGLDFKNVDWIIQFDLSSQIKEYINRVGRTARIASQGQAISFVMSNEIKYIDHLMQKYNIKLNPKSRFVLQKQFESIFIQNNTDMKFKFRKLINIEDIDEQQESLHAIRQHLTKLMMDEGTGLKSMAQIAKSSSTRAYAGHSSEMRHIFDLKNLNLTEYSRSFGLYKQLYMTPKKELQNFKNQDKRDINKSLLRPKDVFKKQNKQQVTNIAEQQVDLDAAIKRNQTLFSRRLQKSKIKDLEKELREKGNQNQKQKYKILEELKQAKANVFTDERKIEQRKMGFTKAKTNLKHTQLLEFM